MTGKNLAAGVIVPMITPFRDGGNVDPEAADRLTRHIIGGGAAPFVLGTTGESASIPHTGRSRLVRTVVRSAGGEAPVYAGISSTSLAESKQFARDYFELGVDAVVAHMPAYYPLPEEYLYRYFSELADDLPGPLILYNITAVTHQSLPVDLIERLSRHPRIIAVKDSERDQERFERSLKLWAGRPDFKFLVGWGAVMADSLKKGAAGIIPSTGNIVPDLYTELYQAAVSGNQQKTEELHRRTSEISEIYQKGYSLGESLAALKLILHRLGLCTPDMLPPLYRLDSDKEARVLEAYMQLR